MYARLWEVRKIWGGIVNNSRAFGTTIKAFISNQFNFDNPVDDSTLFENRKRMIYRHISWLYTLRSQLLIPTPWEHINQGKHIAKQAERRIKFFGAGVFDGVKEDDLKPFLNSDELTKIMEFKNKATQLIDNQSQDLVKLRKENLIDDFRHMELQNILNEFYTLQGKAERIKKFPLPRQYGSTGFVFVAIFIFLLPMGMVGLFADLKDLGELGIWFTIPFTVLLSWIFLMMELVGDYSENPFEGMPNDIPMLSLTRTIEIDLREMLGETDLPPVIEAKDFVLM